MKLTITDVKDRVEYIKSVAWDFESAHSHEDQLHHAFLQHILENGRKEDAAIAKEILETDKIDFARYCA